jgi:UDP-N-acetylmuramate--alanine ligase
MNIYFSGIGGVGIGPLAEIALDIGYTVAGSDPSESLMAKQLVGRGVDLSTDQSGEFLRAQHEKTPIQWLVYTAALPDNHPELITARKLGIKISKRDEFLLHVIEEKNLKLIAIAGTHGKTTTTGMVAWLGRYFGIPLSYCVGTTLSWGPSGRYAPGSEYFVYECDEFDRNFLQFHPYVSIVTTVEHDHPDTYPTDADYTAAFQQFGEQSDTLVTWSEYKDIFAQNENTVFVDEVSPLLRLNGEHNRRNASLILAALEKFGQQPRFVADGLNKFPGTSRRFEMLANNLYTDYGHTPSEIAATLQMARELSDDVVLVYQPHQNVRQHEIRDQYTDELFKDAVQVYWLPTYQSREDPSLPILTPEDLSKQLTNVTISDLDDELWDKIQEARDSDKLVLCMGAGSIDGWVRSQIDKS